MFTMEATAIDDIIPKLTLTEILQIVFDPEHPFPLSNHSIIANIW